MRILKVFGTIYKHIRFKQPRLHLFIKLLSEPHCASSGMCPLILLLSSWRKPESECSSGGSLSGLAKIQTATFFPHIARCKQQESSCDAPFIFNGKESLTVSCIAACISIFPYAYDVKHINRCYLDKLPNGLDI